MAFEVSLAEGRQETMYFLPSGHLQEREELPVRALQVAEPIGRERQEQDKAQVQVPFWESQEGEG